MSAFTPGNWFRGFVVGSGQPCIIGDGDSVVAIMPGEWNGCTQNHADARLIASAPELLKALRRAEEMLRIAGPLVAKYAAEAEAFYDGADCDGTCIAEDCEHATEDAVEAIAKATGATP